jgi:hypothetical protein
MYVKKYFYNIISSIILFIFFGMFYHLFFSLGLFAYEIFRPDLSDLS